MEPITEELIVVEKRVLLKLYKTQARKMDGWIAAMFMLAGIVTVLICDAHLVNKLAELQKQIKTLQEQQSELDITQQKSTLAFVKAWEEQQQAYNAVISWSEYIKGRDDLSRYNRTEETLPVLTQNLGTKHK